MVRKRLCGISVTKKHRARPISSLLLQDLLFSSSLHHQYPKDLPQGTTLLIKKWQPWTCKKKETSEEFKTYNLVDVNGGLWYGVLIFTFWRDQVEKRAMLEPDMGHNYTSLYKTHKDTFQIMLTPKPKRLYQRRNKIDNIIKVKTIKQSFFLKGFF